MHEYNLRPREEQRCSFTAGHRRHGQQYQRSAKNAHSSTTTNATELKTALQPRSLTSEQMQQYSENITNVHFATKPNATKLKTTIHVRGYNNAIETISIGTIHPEDICTVCQERYANEDHAIQVKGCGHVYHPQCLSPWAVEQAKNSCPNCRAQLVRMQDPEQEQKKICAMDQAKMEVTAMYLPSKDADSPLVLDLALRDDTEGLSVPEVILDAEATSDEDMMAYDSNNTSYSDTPSSPPVIHLDPPIHWVHPPVVEVMPDTKVTNGDDMMNIDTSETMDSDTSSLASSDNEEPHATPPPSAPARRTHITQGLPTPAASPLLPPQTLAPRRALPIFSPQILPRNLPPGPRYHDPSLHPLPHHQFAVLWHHPAGSPFLYYTSEAFHEFMQPGSRAEQAWIRGEVTVWIAIPRAFTGRTVRSGGWVYELGEDWWTRRGGRHP
jgi:hypothetical protein